MFPSRYFLFFLPLIFAAFFIDAEAARWIEAHKDTDLKNLRYIARYLTHAGDSVYYLVPTGLILVLHFMLKNKIFARFIPLSRDIFIVVGASGIVVTLLKALFARARPRLLFQEDITGFNWLFINSDYTSFPSGHTTTTFAMAGVLAYFFPKYAGLFYLFSAVIAATRVILGSHYIADILAGSLLGLYTAHQYILLRYKNKSHTS